MADWTPEVMKAYCDWKLRCRQHSEEFARAQISRRTWNEEDDAGFLEYLRRCGYQVDGNKVYCSPEEWRGLWAAYSDSPGETGDDC